MELLTQIAGIAVVFALLGLALWGLGRKKLLVFGGMRIGASRGGQNLQFIERLNLTPQHSIHLVRTSTHRLVIAVHPAGCTLLESFPIHGMETGGHV
ncbi:MAG TPA: flagellar biosynthetic protein FliO [Bryobacteraceae bacterium]|nr:flagellar biosynthetic protein FliO [Bryobacteraceae bacterium]